jgi:hypothetical protein
MKLVVLCILTLLAGCGSDVSTARMGGVFPAREPTCSLELRNGTLTMELTSAYDTVGSISVQGREGEAPNAPRILALVKPEACALGGEVVLVNTSMNITNGISTSSNHSYLVFRKKQTGPQQAQKF